MSSDEHVDPVAMGVGKDGEGDHSRGNDTQVPQALNDVSRQYYSTPLATQTVVCGEGHDCVEEREERERQRGQYGGIEWIEEDGSTVYWTESKLNGVQMDDELWSRDDCAVKETKKCRVSS